MINMAKSSEEIVGLISAVNDPYNQMLYSQERWIHK